MSVKRGAKPLLVKVVANESNGTAEDKETVEGTNLDILFSFLRAECTTVTKQINKADSDATVNIQDECILLRRRHLLNSEGIVEKTVAGEVLLDVLLDELDTRSGLLTLLILWPIPLMSLLAFLELSTNSS